MAGLITFLASPEPPRLAFGRLDSTNTNVGVAKRAAGNTLSAMALVPGVGSRGRDRQRVLARISHAEFYRWWNQGGRTQSGTLETLFKPGGVLPAVCDLDSANDRTRRVRLVPKRGPGHLLEKPFLARALWH